MGDVSVIVLAAGLSRRFGTQNKLLIDWEGEPLIRRVVKTALTAVSPRGGRSFSEPSSPGGGRSFSEPSSPGGGRSFSEPSSPGGRRSSSEPSESGIFLVTGHEAELIEDAVDDLPVTLVRNERYAEGMGTSIAAGVRAAPSEARGFLIIPADMPRLRAETLATLAGIGLAEASPSPGVGIATCRATWGRSAPTYFCQSFRSDLEELGGDGGARALLRVHSEDVWELAVDDAEVSDID